MSRPCVLSKHSLAAGALLLLAACNTERAPDVERVVDKEVEVQKAVIAVQTFATALKSELNRGMQEGGPVSAIGICNSEAGPIADQVSGEHGLELGRVSSKFRNPGNAPNDWQAEVLASFEQRKIAGEEPAKLAWSEMTEDGEFRFMKAIPTGPLCLVCHGTEITPDVQAKLDELYPADRATGFEQGDLRGAFVVTRRTR